MGWTPFLLSLFVFIYLCNLPGIIPIIYMPATARIAIPLFLSLLVWVIFIGVGFKHQGFGYIKNSLFPPGVPGPLYILVGADRVHLDVPRPAVLADGPTLRQHARRPHPARHVRAAHRRAASRATRSILKPVGILPFFMLVFITAFEVLVGFLQAYIFTILAAVYIGRRGTPRALIQSRSHPSPIQTSTGDQPQHGSIQHPRSGRR